MDASLRNVIQELLSSKAGERRQAVDRLQDAYSQDAAYRTDKLGPKHWAKLFEALFGAAGIEKQAAFGSGKSKPTALKHFMKTLETIRGLVERSRELLNGKALGYLYSGLLKTLKIPQLPDEVSLNCLKTLNHLTSYQPHLDHMDEESTWVPLVELCLNILLNDPLNTKLIGDEANRSSLSPSWDEDDDLPSDSNPKKRRRPDPETFPPPNETKPQQGRQISVLQVQVECASLLSILLQSPRNPICALATTHLFPPLEYNLSSEEERRQKRLEKLPTALFDRLQRFLKTYPGESSLLHDYLASVAATLDCLALNAVHEVRDFAQATWRTFVLLWRSSKEKRLKEKLLIILRHLFPYIIVPEHILPRAPRTKGHDAVLGLDLLWSVLDKEADKSRANGLDLSSLRMEIIAPEDIPSQRNGSHPFIANTFRSDWNFDGDQALSWAILELQANCARQLFLMLESNSPPTPTAQRASKRIKYTSPIASLLTSVKNQTSANVRSYNLQVLLFFVDQHWSVLHDGLKREVVKCLEDCVGDDNFDIQSWAFLNFAAIAFAEKRWASQNQEILASSQAPEVIDASTWDGILAHAVRRATVPQVCRAACHAAHSILTFLFRFTPPSGHIFLTTHRVLQEIEAFGKDMDVQGPHAPYDSVCMFLTRCLKVASQDVRLYRMNLEDTVLKWLTESWTITGADKASATSYSINDVLLLLATISGLGKHSDLIVRPSLPSCPIVDAMTKERQSSTIREFLLGAKLPTYASDREPSSNRGIPPLIGESMESTPSSEDEQVPPHGRKQRITVFLQRIMDALSTEWQSRLERKAYPSIEVARRTLDFITIAITYEATLEVNSIRPNRRSLQVGGTLLTSVFAFSHSNHWTLAERVALVSGFEPLVLRSRPPDDAPWEAITFTGNFQNDLQRGEGEAMFSLSDPASHLRGIILRSLWKKLYTPLEEMSTSIRSYIGRESGSVQPMDVDDTDGFGPINAETTVTSTANQPGAKNSLLYRLFEVHFILLIRGPLLHSLSGEPTRDRVLVDYTIDAASGNPPWFMMVLPILLQEIEIGSLELNPKQLQRLFEALGGTLRSYSCSYDQDMLSLIAKALCSTIKLWANESCPPDTMKFVGRIHSYWADSLIKNHFRAWEIRDVSAQFLQRYLTLDPATSSWRNVPPDPYSEPVTPKDIMEHLLADTDIRVRVRATIAVSQPFRVLQNQQANELYHDMRMQLSTKMDHYEAMMTRFLALGNIMVVSSVVRRGPYWHLLEICAPKPEYTIHVEAILLAVVQRLGMSSLASLFKAYAYQLTYSIIEKREDFHAFPPRLFGYRERSTWLDAVFRIALPIYIAMDAWPQYEQHSKSLSKAPSDGIEENFGEAVGFAAAVLLDTRGDLSDLDIETNLCHFLHTGQDSLSNLEEHADTIVAAMLRTLGEQDYTAQGPIVGALRQTENINDKVIQVFHLLTRHRQLQTFVPHPPNSPALLSTTVLRGLSWIFRRIPGALNKATVYHVMHGLFACIDDTPLVNEKFRLLNALCLWIAYRHEEFSDPTLLYTVLHGASALLGQEDLARAAQSIIEWTFRCYKKLKAADSRLSRTLIRISSICHDYATQKYNIGLQSLGKDLDTWIDGQVASLGSIPVLLPAILKALPAWPYQPSDDLAALQRDITLDDLSAILQDDHITSSKFRVVRRLTDSHFRDEIDFATRDFWRLKESMPAVEGLQREDINAFSDLIISHHGQIDSLKAEPPTLNTIRNRHRRLNRVRRHQAEGQNPSGDDMMIAARDSILYGLLGLLEHEAPSLVHDAYNTLRLMMKQVAAESFSPYRTEVEFLQTYHRHSLTRPSRDIGVLVSSDFYIETSSKFPQWISSIAKLVSDILSIRDPTYGPLCSILSSDVSTAEEMFPVLVFALLRDEQLKSKSVSQDHPYKTTLSRYFTKILQYPNASLHCFKSVVDVVLHLRNFHSGAQDPLSYNKWLDIDFYLLSRSAVRCGAYTTALLFLELAPEVRPESTLDSNIAEQIQYEIYAHIDEPDGFYGIQTDNLHRFLVERFRHEQQWDRAFHFHGATLEAGSDSIEPETAEGIVNAFHSFGFNHLAMDALQSSEERVTRHKSSSSSLGYRLGWRSETWDLPDSDVYTAGASLYNALRRIHRERDSKAVTAYLDSALYREMDKLRSLGTENITQIREVLQSLMCLYQIDQWNSGELANELKEKKIDLMKWQDFLTISSKFGFSDLENIMSVRISLIQSKRQQEERQQIGILTSPFLSSLLELEKRCLLSLSKAARESGNTQIALNSVLRAQKLEKTRSFEVNEEYANVLWSLKEERIAVNFLNDLIQRNNAPEPMSPVLKAVTHSRLGTWISEACLEKPTDIWIKYFEPAIHESMPYESNEAKDIATVYHQCAVFADRQYHATLHSADAERRKLYVERKQQEIKVREIILKSMKPGDPDHSALQKDQDDAQKLLDTDVEHNRKHNTARNHFLRQALAMYSRCLQVTNVYDNDASIKFSSLWFSNFEDEENIGKVVQEALGDIPSRKFIFLAHQLAARITKSHSAQSSKNQVNLQNLIFRLCQEHPFHSVYQVYCLQADTTKSTQASGPRPSLRQSTSQPEQNDSQNDRRAAAEDILSQLREDSHTGPRILEMEELCAAYLEWAKLPIKGNSRYKKRPQGGHKVPEHLKIRKMTKKMVPVITAETKIDLTMKYLDCVWIEKYSDRFETAGGVNLPKIIVCYGSDGLKYKQLFKGEGKDDLRQDAVMEQVFELVNQVLDQDRETSRRSLRVRSYKVIPLDAQAGVLEFVGNTSPLRDWLTNKHAFYRPQDLTPPEAASRLSKIHQSKGSPEARVKVFKEVRSRFQPVFRHFFTEKHRNPMAWFSTRLRYTRSVATSSIVGHILGLGDRHTSNILMDNNTGEVVHIDLGIAFDQGKLLPVPELVPFRLTRDIVDGMGVSGTQGVFQRCAEETLRVLREGSDIIMTVLEVFKHDPLHSWTASEIKIRRVQDPPAPTSAVTTTATAAGGAALGIDMASGTAEESADRALSSVARKLSKSLSVESTVNELIAEATDVTNLGQIYCGWSPHM